MTLTIALCGDIMLGAEVDEFMADSRVGDWLSDVSPAWSSADLVIGNLESPCVQKAPPIEGRLPELVFRAPASRLSELGKAGFSALTLANNHILNCGEEGLRETMEGLDRLGIYHTGAGMDLAEAMQPAFIPVRGLIVGLVAFCYGPPAGRSSPGVAPCEPKVMRRALAAARTRADLVIAALHDGLEYSDVPPAKTRARSRFLAENGADAVFGHHPHVLQGVEWHGGVPIAYSLGDLLFHNSLPHVAARNFSRIAMAAYAPAEVRRDPDKFSRGAILTIRFCAGKASIEWHPFRQDHDLRPRLSSGDAKKEDLRRLANLDAILLDPKDYRHGLANWVCESVRRKNLDSLGMQEVLQLARRPKWRYVSQGLPWLWTHLRRGLAMGGKD